MPNTDIGNYVQLISILKMNMASTFSTNLASIIIQWTVIGSYNWKEQRGWNTAKSWETC